MDHFKNSPVVAALVFAMGSVACSSAVTSARHASAAPRTCPSAEVKNESDIRALAGCTRIQGDLRIEGSTLESLAGLQRIKSVTGSLRVAENPKLETLSGLERLRSVDSLVVTGNPMLDSLDGIQGLRRARSIAIDRSPEIENLQGLEAVRALESLSITRTGISSVRGVSMVSSVGSLVVMSNPRLIGLGGFLSIEAVESVRVIDNRRLAGHEFLAGLASVSGPVVIEGNSSIAPSEVDALVRRLSASRDRVIAAR